MTQDGGLGAVVSKTIHRTDIARLFKHKHGNGKDWWLIFKAAQHTYNSTFILNYFFGIQLDHVDSAGFQGSTNGDYVSINRRSICICN